MINIQLKDGKPILKECLKVFKQSYENRRRGNTRSLSTIKKTIRGRLTFDLYFEVHSLFSKAIEYLDLLSCNLIMRSLSSKSNVIHDLWRFKRKHSKKWNLKPRKIRRKVYSKQKFWFQWIVETEWRRSWKQHRPIMIWSLTLKSQRWFISISMNFLKAKTRILRVTLLNWLSRDIKRWRTLSSCLKILKRDFSS